MDTPKIVQQDPWLDPFSEVIKKRINYVSDKEQEVLSGSRSLSDFASGHLYFGLHRTNSGWVIRDWAPNATAVFLIGTFNNWQEQSEYELNRKDFGNWELELAPDALHHLDLYKFIIYWEGGRGERIPAWATRVVQDSQTYIFNAQVWEPDEPYHWKNSSFQRDKTQPPLIYEAHVGMAGEAQDISSYAHFRDEILPRIVRAGYNTLQLMAIQEHPYYGSFGYHVSNFFAASSRFGTPDDLKSLIDAAHQAGISVIMDLVHSHSVKNEQEGLGRFDGTPYQYFHDGPRREHIAWDSLCFDYGKPQVMHFLLSNCKYWLQEYKFDGFRFDGVTSMIYYDHGLSRAFTNYSMYFDGQQDEDALAYLKLANTLIHEVNPGALTIAEEMSGMPGLAAPVADGGLGFDYRLSMGVPDYWIKIIKEVPDEQWDVGALYHELTTHRPEEKIIGYAESHDQALVGDKTIIFRLMDKEMYFAMNKDSNNLVIDRGMALHKMIRLATLSTAGGGYLNFMGNEFGHPEWIDFPRQGNNWSYKYARRQWHLVDDNSLRYHLLADFDKAMIEMAEEYNLLAQGWFQPLLLNRSDQIMAFERGDLLFVFNFHPTQSYTDYGIQINPGKFRVLLNTDSPDYGGFDRVDENLTYYSERGGLSLSSPHYFKGYFPSRTAIVYKRLPVKSVYDI